MIGSPFVEVKPVNPLVIDRQWVNLSHVHTIYLYHDGAWSMVTKDDQVLSPTDGAVIDALGAYLTGGEKQEADRDRLTRRPPAG